jgi:hypothetical protein
MDLPVYPVNVSTSGLRILAARLRRHARVVKYARGDADDPTFLSFNEACDLVGEDVVRPLAKLFTHKGLNGEDLIETRRLADVLDLIADGHRI